MPDQPTIPPIDPELAAEVRRLTAEAQVLLMNQVVPLCERVGATLVEMERLEVAVDHDDAAVNEIRARLGYGVLLGTMAVIASHAGAAGDEPTATFDDPDWYNRLREQRHERWARLDKAGL